MKKLYRKKPVVIEAIQFDGTMPSVTEISQWSDATIDIGQDMSLDKLFIPTLEGMMTASVGDYIIKGLQGEFYPCKPDIFEKSYEEVIATPYSNSL
jgi:hypothetical protein